MELLILTVLATAALYLCFKFVDHYLPKKIYKKVILIEKHTEDHFSSTMDCAGSGYQVKIKRFMLTVRERQTTKTEAVSLDNYSKAVIGQDVQLVRVLSRFSNKLIRLDLVV